MHTVLANEDESLQDVYFSEARENFNVYKFSRITLRSLSKRDSHFWSSIHILTDNSTANRIFNNTSQHIVTCIWALICTQFIVRKHPKILNLTEWPGTFLPIGIHRFPLTFQNYLNTFTTNLRFNPWGSLKWFLYMLQSPIYTWSNHTPSILPSVVIFISNILLPSRTLQKISICMDIFLLHIIYLDSYKRKLRDHISELRCIEICLALSIYLFEIFC